MIRWKKNNKLVIRIIFKCMFYVNQAFQTCIRCHKQRIPCYLQFGQDQSNSTPQERSHLQQEKRSTAIFNTRWIPSRARSTTRLLCWYWYWPTASFCWHSKHIQRTKPSLQLTPVVWFHPANSILSPWPISQFWPNNPSDKLFL